MYKKVIIENISDQTISYQDLIKSDIIVIATKYAKDIGYSSALINNEDGVLFFGHITESQGIQIIGYIIAGYRPLVDSSFHFSAINIPRTKVLENITAGYTVLYTAESISEIYKILEELEEWYNYI